MAPLRIKLGSTKTKPASDRFLDELHSTTTGNPFNDRERIVGNVAGVHMSKINDGEVHLHDIRTLKPNSGGGTHALHHIRKLADKHGVKITGSAKAYSQNPDHLGQRKLNAWYRKHGFRITGDRLSYAPITREEYVLNALTGILLK